MTEPMLKIRGLHKSYGARPVLCGVDLDVPTGSVLCIIGPSGSGKSTLLSCVNHLEPFDAGRLWVDGHLVGYRERHGRLHELPERDVARMRQGIGMVFQQFNLFPHMTALQNIIEAPVHVKRVPRAQAVTRAKSLLERVGLGNKHDRYPAQLSGGEQQRVAIARALAMDPQLMLFDEPTSALDMSVQVQIVDLLRDLQARHGLAYVFISHDLRVVRALANEIIVMRAGQVVEQGTATAIFAAPKSDYTRALFAAAFDIETAADGLVNQ